MKNKVLRVVSGAMLSAMLIVAAVTLPAQAAVNGVAVCEHTHINGTVYGKQYTNADQQMHQVSGFLEGICLDCNIYVRKRVVYAEKHELKEDGKCECGFKPQY